MIVELGSALTVTRDAAPLRPYQDNVMRRFA